MFRVDGRNYDLKGKKFGQWTVLEFDLELSTKRGASHWKCQCDCGNIRTVGACNLRRGTSKCCKNCGKRKKHRLERGIAASHCVLKSYKYGAKKRNHDFLLTDDEFYKLVKMNCHYCGCEPKSIYRGKEIFGEYVYNGLDRIDNNKGYALDNVVPCCRECNFGKGHQSYETFNAWIDRLIEHRKNK